MTAAGRRRTPCRCATGSGWSGVVQGVGFRPFVHRLATELGLAGHVGNDTEGVFVEVEGAAATCRSFERPPVADAPPLARIFARRGVRHVEIRHERRASGSSRASVGERGADLRRRPTSPCATTAWPSCSTRRIAASATRSSTAPTAVPASPSPSASPTTGPTRPCATSPCAPPAPASTTTRPTAGSTPSRWPVPAAGHGSGSRARRASSRGPTPPSPPPRRRSPGAAIVAVKGLGGYHLACDATSAAAVGALRRRKTRPDKPFAVMVPRPGTARAAGRGRPARGRPAEPARAADRPAGPARRAVRWPSRWRPGNPHVGRAPALHPAPPSAVPPGARVGRRRPDGCW